MKKITQAQIDTVLKIVYPTNIPVAQFDALRKLLAELPEEETKAEIPKK